MGSVHVIGAGLAGLSCALRLAERGVRVVLYEATGHAGGRCRSYFDTELDRWTDNGNHLVFSGNGATIDFLASIDSRDSLIDPGRAVFPFLDLASGERWTVHLNDGRVPWWVFQQGRRIPRTRWTHYLALLRFARSDSAASVADVVPPRHPLFSRLIEPLAVAALNATAAEGSANLLWSVIAESFGRGGYACRPLIARDGLSMSLVDPAVKRLRELGAEIHFSHRLRELAFRGHAVADLCFVGRDVYLTDEDQVVLAVPHRVAAALLPAIDIPEGGRAIVNAHFRLRSPVPLKGGPAFLALLNGTAHWLFFRGDLVSATVSAAEGLVERPAEEIARLIWSDVRQAVGSADASLPPWRIVKEKTATFAQTPPQTARRPPAEGPYRNLLLAGDWTRTGLPATIEGAVRSGQTAARLALARHRAADVPIPAAQTPAMPPPLSKVPS